MRGPSERMVGHDNSSPFSRGRLGGGGQHVQTHMRWPLDGERGENRKNPHPASP